MLNIVHYALIAIQTRTEFIFLEKIRNCKLSAIGFIPINIQLYNTTRGRTHLVTFF